MGATAISWFEGKVNKMAVPTGKMSLERTTEDFKIDEMTAYVMNLERCVVRVARQVHDVMYRSLHPDYILFKLITYMLLTHILSLINTPIHSPYSLHLIHSITPGGVYRPSGERCCEDLSGVWQRVGGVGAVRECHRQWRSVGLSDESTGHYCRWLRSRRGHPRRDSMFR